ncbi:multiple antibiotic resistance protein MarB [Pseudenterobacter timonensis]|uniref:Multiple antibiotic resistance protein MarB n=1 Tax=Pseudenterobacter timonensis TaxID=1755099 RepID=A0AAE4IVD6_9ENTR|nr:multiple antibiotic resistance protein MarB [Pseudenterobacter timonensis]MDR9890397.1 multiple antibiotic resistance protein MarB [Pseudenterobacter timonensis]
MKVIVSALALLALTCGQSYAEQTQDVKDHNQRNVMILPSAQQKSPFDFNHMASGSDKSDELGVPYYNGHDL